MSITKQEIFKGCQLINIPCIKEDRGNLCYLQEDETLPLNIRRVFWIYDIPENAERGGHAHRSCSELVFVVKGSFDIYVNNGKDEKTIHCDNPNLGIFIDVNVWCCLKNFEPGTICMVVASDKYDASGYINNFEDFLKINHDH